MSRADEVFTLLVESNPIPDPDALGLSPLQGAAYLTAIEERGSQEETAQAPQPPGPNWNHWGILAAAVIAFMLGTLLILSLRGDEQPPIDTHPTVTTIGESAPTTEGPTTTLDAAEVAWQAVPMFLNQGKGLFRSNLFMPALSFDTGVSTWVKSELIGTDVFEMHYQVPPPINEERGGMANWIQVFHGETTIEETLTQFINWQANYPDSIITEPTPSVIGGAEGVTFDMTNLPLEDPSVAAPYQPPASGPPFAAGEEVTVHIVDVNNQVIIVSHVFSKAWPGVAIPPYTDEEYAVAKQSARDIIQTITWKDLD